MTTPWDRIADRFVEAEKEVAPTPVSDPRRPPRPKPQPGPRPGGFLERFIDSKPPSDLPFFIDPTERGRFGQEPGLPPVRDPLGTTGRFINKFVLEPLAAEAEALTQIAETGGLTGGMPTTPLGQLFSGQIGVQETGRELLEDIKERPLAEQIVTQAVFDATNIVPGIGFTKVPRAAAKGLKAAGPAVRGLTRKVSPEVLSVLRNQRGGLVGPGGDRASELSDLLTSLDARLEQIGGEIEGAQWLRESMVIPNSGPLSVRGGRRYRLADIRAFAESEGRDWRKADWFDSLDPVAIKDFFEGKGGVRPLTIRRGEASATDLRYERTRLLKDYKAADDELDALLQLPPEDIAQPVVAPGTAVQGGLGIGEPAQQVGMDLGGRGTPLQPLIEPERVAAQAEQARLLREGQQALPEGAVPPPKVPPEPPVAGVPELPAGVVPPREPPAPLSETGPIMPSPELPGGSLTGDMQPFGEVVEIASRPDVWRKIIQAPGLKQVVGGFNPSGVAQTPAELAVVARAVGRHQAEQLSIGSISQLNALGTQQKVFGKLDNLGFIAEGPLKGVTVNTIRTFPERYAAQMTDAQRQWVEMAAGLERSKLNYLKANDVPIKELAFEEGGQYAGRRVVSKMTPGGEVGEVAFVGAGPGRRIGAKLAAEKHRVFASDADAIAEGFRYMPDDEALALNIQGAYNRVADKRMAEWLLDRVEWASLAGPEGPKVARHVAQQRLALAKRSIDALQRAIRGETLPTGTVKAIERLFPDFADQLREPTRIHIQDVLNAAAKLQEPERVLEVPKIGTLIKLKKLVEKARLALEANPGNPQLQRALSKLQSSLGFTKYRIGLGEPLTLPHQPVKELRAASVQELREVIDAIRGTRVGKRFQGGLIDQIRQEARQAEAAAARSAEAARTTRFGEATVQAPAFAGIKFTGPEAQRVAQTLRDSMDPQFIKALVAVNKVNSVARYFMLAGDASPMMIQLLFLAGADPRVYGKAAGGFVRAVFDPQFLARYVANPENQAIIAKYPDLILPMGGRTEFTEAMAKGGLLRAGPLKIAGTVLEPGQRGFEGALTVAGIEHIKALDHLGTTAERIADVTQFVNEFRGLTSSSRLGVSLAHRQAETALVLAPRYNRAIASLLFDTTRGNLRGSLARKALARGIAAVSAMAVVISAARGESFEEITEHFDPNSPKFFTWEVAGQNVGPGTKIRSIVKLFAATAKDPARLANIDQFTFMRSPAWRFLRGNLSPVMSTGLDLLTGRDFLGDPTRDGLLKFTKTVGENFMPIWMQTVLLEGGSVPDRAVRGAAEFFGGRAYPVNIPSKLAGEWRSSLKDYFDIPTSAVERKEQGVKTTRDVFRRRNPEIDAKLFITGRVSSLKTSSAATVAVRLIQENEINPAEIDGIAARQKAREDAKRVGLRMERNRVDDLIARLERARPTPQPNGASAPEAQAPLATWAQLGPRLDGDLLRALGGLWYEGQPITDVQRQRLQRVFQEFPLGQTDFNTWLKQALKQTHARSLNAK